MTTSEITQQLFRISQKIEKNIERANEGGTTFWGDLLGEILEEVDDLHEQIAEDE